MLKLSVFRFARAKIATAKAAASFDQLTSTYARIMNSFNGSTAPRVLVIGVFLRSLVS
jgi:hypothetical protein